MRRIEFLPAVLVHLAVEAGQHHRALRQTGDHSHQVASRGLRTGRAGGNHRRRGWRRAPALGLSADRAGTPVDGIDLPAFGQQVGPGGADDGEELQGTAPVMSEVAVDQGLQLLERHAVDGQFIEQAAQLARQLQRLRRRLRDRLAVVVGKAATSRASSASRSAGSIAGGSVRAVASPDSVSNSLSSRSPSGAMRGRIVGLRRRRAGRPRAAPAPSGGSAPGSAPRPAPAGRRNARPGFHAPARRRSADRCRW